MSENDGLFLSEEARQLYSRFAMSPERTSVIVGSLFGDGSLLVTRKDRTPNFYENHSMKQLEYLKWKASMLGVPDGVKFRLMTQGYCKGQLVPYFQLRSHAFTKLEKTFYIDGENGRRKKVVTKEGIDLLVGSALAIAVFHMDDGEYNVFSNQVILNTCDFTMEENHTIASRLGSLLGGQIRVKIKRKKYPRLALSTRATDQFVKIVKPYIHPTMKYKIDQDITHRLDQGIVAKLRREYGKRPAKLIAEEAGVTFKEAQVIANRMGLSRHRGYVRHRDKPFTEEERSYLMKNYSRIPIREIALVLHTTPRCLYQLVHRLRQANRFCTIKGDWEEW